MIIQSSLDHVSAKRQLQEQKEITYLSSVKAPTAIKNYWKPREHALWSHTLRLPDPHQYIQSRCSGTRCGMVGTPDISTQSERRACQDYYGQQGKAGDWTEASISARNDKRLECGGNTEGDECGYKGGGEADEEDYLMEL